MGGMTRPSRLNTNQRPVAIPAKLIFNPSSGRPDQSPAQLSEILSEMQAWHIRPEVTIVRPGSRLETVAEDAVRRGIRLVVVAGGDGTIDAVAAVLAGASAVLGVIPTGTRNNIALSLAIPLNDIPEAVAILRRGRRILLDVGCAHSGSVERPFLEAATVGLISAL
jgi:diacylglycerol kinase (ATP)